MAPFTPFFTEGIYQNLRRALGPDAPESVHFCDFPAAEPPLPGDKQIEASVERMQVCGMGTGGRCFHMFFVFRGFFWVLRNTLFNRCLEDTVQRVVELTRGIRDKQRRPVKTPVLEIVVVHDDSAFLDDIAGAWA
jgi:isoleucyl-tRNA synthetase